MHSGRAPAGSAAGGAGVVAYLSPEFGVDETLPQYSGGLGVLAGDHLKAASDAGMALVGLGLFYRHGYFRQLVAPNGDQQVEYQVLDPHGCGLEEAGKTTVPVGDRQVTLRIWRRDVGSVPLYLLDSDLEVNGAEDRAITDALYGGDREHRIRQEIVLGMGAVYAFDALGIEPAVFHLNEGHAGFVGLERIRRAMHDGASLDEAIEGIRSSTIFTTHTPVPAGIDRFARGLMQRYFQDWVGDCGVKLTDLMALGSMPGEREFNMAAFCLRIAGHANGVSELHGRVSRTMFAPLWTGRRVDDVPITSVTNGVHAPTWTSPEIGNLLERAVGDDWPRAPAEAWQGVEELDDEEIRGARRAARERLRAIVEERASASGASLEPDVLTIGFARRFATYKRAALLLSDEERLRRLLLEPDRRVQLVFAGKAHPADRSGQEVLARVTRLSADPATKGRVVFLTDYDMAIARAMVSGCDVWLNNPLRGLEACGTSGQKAALNGVLNCSMLDGWWDEMFDGRNGWPIPSEEGLAAGAQRDRAEADAALTVLEEQVVPLYYVDGPGGPSSAWWERVRHAWRSLGPRVTAARMIRDYRAELYGPALQTH